MREISGRSIAPILLLLLSPSLFASSGCRHTMVFLSLLIPAFCLVVSAVHVNFDDCLPPNIRSSSSSSTQQLHFTPQTVDAVLAPNANQKLNITVTGKVSGLATWTRGNSSDDPGTIVDADPNYTTLFTTWTYLGKDIYRPPSSRFCKSLVSGECPIGNR